MSTSNKDVKPAEVVLNLETDPSRDIWTESGHDTYSDVFKAYLNNV